MAARWEFCATEEEEKKEEWGDTTQTAHSFSQKG